MTRLLLVMLGGALGSGARYVLSDFVQQRTTSAFPTGTFAVNVVGCLVFGLIAGFALGRTGFISQNTRVFLLVGICGGFTTFSAFSYETMQLLRDGEFLFAGINVGGQVLASLLALWAGTAVAGAV